MIFLSEKFVYLLKVIIEQVLIMKSFIVLLFSHKKITEIGFFPGLNGNNEVRKKMF
jgi:hypothetical protein